MDMQTGLIVIVRLCVPVQEGRNVTSWKIPREHTWKGYPGGHDDIHMISGQVGGSVLLHGTAVIGWSAYQPTQLWHSDSMETEIIALLTD